MRAFQMIGQVLTTPIGFAHEATHAFAAAFAAGDPPVIEVDPRGSHCYVDFESTSRWQRPVIALAPTLVALMVSPIVGWLLLTSGADVALIAAIALALYGFPSAADRQQAICGLEADDMQPSGAD